MYNPSLERHHKSGALFLRLNIYIENPPRRKCDYNHIFFSMGFQYIVYYNTLTKIAIDEIPYLLLHHYVTKPHSLKQNGYGKV